jgi:hypothetical protein
MTGITRRMSLAWALEEVVDRIQYRHPDLLGERRREILEMHKMSNRELSEFCDIDLAQFGYY